MFLFVYVAFIAILVESKVKGCCVNACLVRTCPDGQASMDKQGICPLQKRSQHVSHQHFAFSKWAEPPPPSALKLAMCLSHPFKKGCSVLDSLQINQIQNNKVKRNQQTNNQPTHQATRQPTNRLASQPAHQTNQPTSNYLMHVGMHRWGSEPQGWCCVPS